MSDPLRTVDDLAAMLGRTAADIYWMNHAGTGPRRIKIGKRVYYRQSDIDAWLTAHYVD